MTLLQNKTQDWFQYTGKNNSTRLVSNTLPGTIATHIIVVGPAYISISVVLYYSYN